MESEKKINKRVLAAAICALAIVAALVFVLIKMFTGDSSMSINPGEPVDYEEAGYLKLGQYKGIKISVAVSKEDIEEEKADILEDAEEYEHIEGIAKTGDMVSVNIKGFMEGVPLEDWDMEDELIGVGDEDYFAEFDNAINGMTTGETKDVDVLVPADYGDEEIDGKQLLFQVTLNYICGNEIEPKITDEFVTRYSEGECTSAENFDEYIDSCLYKENIEYLSENVWEEVVKNVSLNKYNKVEVKNAEEETVRSYEDFADVSGLSTEELLDSFGMTDDDVEEVSKDAALERMTAKTIAAKEGLVLDEEKYKQLMIEEIEYEDDSYKNETLEEIENDYVETMSEDPKEAMLLEFVKRFVADNADVEGLR